MNQQCKEGGCNEPCKSRHDRPGKFFTLCVVHYAEYQRQKNKESYYRYQDDRIKRAADYRKDNPEAYKASYQKYEAKPEVKKRKRAYMRLYNSPYRAFVLDHCELCPYVSIDPEWHRDIDVHHLDRDDSNNDPTNLQSLCAPCHRLLGATEDIPCLHPATTEEVFAAVALLEPPTPDVVRGTVLVNPSVTRGFKRF